MSSKNVAKITSHFFHVTPHNQNFWLRQCGRGKNYGYTIHIRQWLVLIAYVLLILFILVQEHLIISIFTRILLERTSAHTYARLEHYYGHEVIQVSTRDW